MATDDHHAPAVTPHADEPIVRLRHPWRWVAVVVIAAYLAEAVWFFATSDAMRWDLVRGYLFEESIMRGLLDDREADRGRHGWSASSLGTLLAVMRLSDNPVLRGLAGGLRLAVPRYADPGPAAVLVLPRLGDARGHLRHPVRARVHHRRDQRR